MAANTLSILTPSVNNLSARVFVRAAGLDFEERDVWGKKDAPDLVMKDPALLTPLIGTLYPLVARATYPTLHFPHYAGEAATSDAGDEVKAKAAKGRRGGDRDAARRVPLVLPRRQAVHRPRPPDDRRHPAGGHARVPAGDRLRLPGLGRGGTWPR